MTQIFQGGWTFAFQDYYEAGITKYVDSYQLFNMAKIIDVLSKISFTLTQIEPGLYN
jgi:hypothetical protein